ncbi:MAG: hypothetical protein KKG99_01600 [Bacteroidetes bacterium]|nr:hypothetical protein [Bacteroidota bacterium]
MRKKWKLMIGAIIITIIMCNCKKNGTDYLNNDNILLEGIILFTQNELQKAQLNRGEREMSLGSFDFENLHLIDDNIIILNIKEDGFKNTLNENKKVIYYIKEGIIIGGSIVNFKSNHSIEYIETILSDIISVKLMEFLYNDKKDHTLDIRKEFSFRKSNYSGEIIFTKLNNKLQLALELKTGDILSSKSRQGIKKFKSNNLKDIPGGLLPGECIDWYLVTTYHYADGSSRTTEWYLYSECFGDENESGNGSSATSNFFDDVKDKININGPNVFKEIVCLIRNLRESGQKQFVTDLVEGYSGSLSSYNIAQVETSYNNHNVEITVVYDDNHLTNQIGIHTETHLGQVMYHEISVTAGMDYTGSKPNLILLRFEPEDDDFAMSVWHHITGLISLWSC